MGNRLLRDINSRIAFLGLKRSEIAARLHKDASSIFRQLDEESGNPQLSSLVAIADAIGAEIVLSTPEMQKALQDANVEEYRNKIIEFDAEIKHLRERVSYLESVVVEKTAKIQKRDEIIAKRDETISHKDAIIEEKDRTIARKDAKLSEFVDIFFLKVKNIGK